ncbi:MAG: hypothetical protein WBM71_02190 [Sedimenticolaceae bacterium]|jgi:hypothetical protein
MLPEYEIDRSHIEPVGVVPGARRDKYVRYSHEMTDDTAEASARALTRAVPVIYGLLLGALIENLLLGASLGVVLSIALDSRMGRDSLSLPLLRPLFVSACPAIAAIMHGLARVIRAIRLPVPSSWDDMPCGAPKL